MSILTDPSEVLAALVAPFDRTGIRFKPGALTKDKTRALAMPYVDARTIMDRLDKVVGPLNWQDDYEFLPDGSAVCRLKLRIGGEWIVKTDVGGQSQQEDEGDRRKAAVSDALKRAAVKWGVGRYLYGVAAQWCDYDADKKRFKQQPALGGQAPLTQATQQRAPTSQLVTPPAKAPVNDGMPTTNGKAAHPSLGTKQKPADRPPPRTPAELADRLNEFGAALVKAGLCDHVDELLNFVRGQLGTRRVPQHVSPDKWPAALIPQAMAAAKSFEGNRRQRARNVDASNGRGEVSAN